MKLMCVAAVAAGLALAGCYGPQDLDNLYVFAKHDRSGLCFVGEDWNSDGMLDAGTMSNVPCTPEVLKEIESGIRVPG